VRDFRHWEIFFRGRSSEGDGGLDVFRFQAGKSGKNFFGGIASGQAGKHGAERNACPPKDGLASARFGISNDSLLVAFLFAALVAHGASTRSQV